MSAFTPVCAADTLTPGQGKQVRVHDTELALFNVDGEFFAMEDTCLHAGGPLHQGQLEGHVVTCPWHDWKFDVRTGCSPLHKIGLTRFQVRVNGDQIEVGPAVLGA
jgi:nitrite reductase (NADH) small subunit